MKSMGICRHLILGFLVLFVCGGCSFFIHKYSEKSLAEKTLDEVYYITSPEQHNQILGLQTEGEIDSFLESFWKNYDPDPTTEINELRQIYYDRVKYANEHFAEPGKSGCTSDRGRIYVLYGPPAEITYDNFVQGDFDEDAFNISFSKAYQIWQYDIPGIARKTINHPDFRNLTGVAFVFADLEGFGNYTQIYSTVESELDDARIYQN